MIPIDKFIAAHWQEKFLAISHTPEYLIKIYDLRNGSIVRSYRREYKRVKAARIDEKKQARIIMGDNLYTAPFQKWKDDIQNLIAEDNKLWVVTSTSDDDRGVLIDVFDLEGRYIEELNLRFPHVLYDLSTSLSQMQLSGENLCLIEKDGNEIYSVVVYKLQR
jgi:hypothetical protein